MMRGMWLVVVGLVLAPSGFGAEETYTIKVKESSAGDTSLVEKSTTETTSVTLVDGQGTKIQDKEETKTHKFVYQLTVLEKPKDSKKATKLRRHYDKAQVKVGDDQRALPYEGKTVLIEKKGDRYHFQIEGGQELTGKDAEELNQEFNKGRDESIDYDKLMLPKKPVRVKESWKIDAEPLVKGLGEEVASNVDAAKTVANGKLLKAYKKAGHQFGEMEVRVVMPIKTFGAAGQKLPVEDGAKMILEGKLDGCIDGSMNEGKGKMEMSMNLVANIDQGGNKFKLTLKVTMKEDSSEKEVTKK